MIVKLIISDCDKNLDYCIYLQYLAAIWVFIQHSFYIHTQRRQPLTKVVIVVCTNEMNDNELQWKSNMYELRRTLSFFFFFFFLNSHAKCKDLHNFSIIIQLASVPRVCTEQSIYSKLYVYIDIVVQGAYHPISYSVEDDGGHDRLMTTEHPFSHSPIPRDLHCTPYRHSVTRFIQE